MRSGLFIVVLTLILANCGPTRAESVTELLISLAQPEAGKTQPEPQSALEELLAEPLSKQALPRIPFRSSYIQSADKKAKKNIDAPMPGAMSVNRTIDGLAAYGRMHNASSFSRNSYRIIDPEHVCQETGKLVGNPGSLFTNFLIEVHRAGYVLNLYAFRGEQKVTLFTCRTGLGSEEFPTPKGSYYIVRIFDDHPLWIPPPQRDWAYGMAPSRSVYGGHMMPFFKKAPLKTGGDDIISDLDSVAGEVKMVDTETYRIHGTDSPWSIGSAQSHGCVRLLNKSVKALSDTLKMYVGITSRSATENGTYVNLARPVHLILH
jgi:hypothetical protein